MPPSRVTSTRRAKPIEPAPPSLLLVGGKGGVGKTTCAAALALASARAGLRTLLISTDPAPSLADALNVPLGTTPRRVRAGLSLHAMELDAPRTFRRWMASRRAGLEKIATEGTLLDREDVSALLDLSLPGIDEVAGLLEIAALADKGTYDKIVVDTAPTGHTLRLLAMPDVLARVAGVFDAMHAKHRAVVTALRGGWQPDAGEALIGELSESADRMHALLRDPDRTAAWWVTLPEPMAVAEALDGIAALQESGLTVGNVIVNRMTAAPPTRCARCDARRRFESAAVRALTRQLPDIPVRYADARPREPRGLRALAAIAGELERARELRAVRASTGTWRARIAGGPEANLESLFGSTARLMLFGGKGGVGKTTSAVATALALAERRRVLLVSTDPAHSVGDALGVEVGDDPRPVPGTRGRLQVREIDAPARFAEVRERYRAAVDAVFARLARGGPLDATYDRRVLSALLELAPPGLDEVVAVADVADLVASPGSADLVVLDLAPSGHALRLLETPAVLQQWTRALMVILLKYRALVGLGDTATLLLDLSKRLGTLRELLRDSTRTVFVEVTRAAALPRLETERTLTRIKRMGVPVGAVLVNAVGRGTCSRCRQDATTEAKELTAAAAIARAAAAPLLVSGEVVPPPSGATGLRAWARTWRVYDRF